MSGETPLRPVNYQCRQEKLAGWPVGITSYQLGDRYYCTADNVNPGACLARGEGASREEAERQALATAEALLSRTRLFPIG
jgi:hypothetical protein